MHAVRADERVTSYCGAVFELQRDAVVVLGEAAAARAEMQRVGFCAPQRAGEHVQEIGAVDGEVRSAVTIDRYRADVEELPAPPGLPIPGFLVLRLARQ